MYAQIMYFNYEGTFSRGRHLEMTARAVARSYTLYP